MSATVTAFPREWVQLVDHVRQRLASAGNATALTHHLVGLSFNYNAVIVAPAAQPLPSPLAAPQADRRHTLLQSQSLAPPAPTPDASQQQLLALLQAVDFIGISAYAAINADDSTPSPQQAGGAGGAPPLSYAVTQLQNSAFTFAAEFLNKTGVDVAQQLLAQVGALAGLVLHRTAAWPTVARPCLGPCPPVLHTRVLLRCPSIRHA